MPPTFPADVGSLDDLVPLEVRRMLARAGFGRDAARQLWLAFACGHPDHDAEALQTGFGAWLVGSRKRPPQRLLIHAQQAGDTGAGLGSAGQHGAGLRKLLG